MGITFWKLMASIPSHDNADNSDIKVLGMCWKLTNDTLSIPGPSLERLEGVYTKPGHSSLMKILLVKWLVKRIPLDHILKRCLKDSWKINLNGILNSLLIVSKVENHLWWPQGNSNVSHSSISWSEYSWTATSSQQFDLSQQCIRQGLCYYSLPSPVFIQ